MTNPTLGRKERKVKTFAEISAAVTGLTSDLQRLTVMIKSAGIRPDDWRNYGALHREIDELRNECESAENIIELARHNALRPK